MIDTVAKNTYFFRLIFSPSTKTENKDGKLNLRQLTTKLVGLLEERLRREIPFIAAEHRNTRTPHTHALMLIARRGREPLVTVEILDELTAGMGIQIQKQRERQQKHVRLRRVPVLEHARGRTKGEVWQPVAHPAHAIRVCATCGNGHLMERISRDAYRC